MTISHHSKKTAPVTSHASTTEEETPTMTTTAHHSKKSSHDTDHASTTEEESPTMSTSHATKKNASASNASSISASAPIVVKPPPADANIPSVPEGAEPTNGTDYRGLVPKKSELAVLGDAVTELENSAEFSAYFGRSMPSLAFIIQVLTAANQWSLMRNKTDAWDLYARTQEGLTWMTARALMAKMKPVFEATSSANADVATAFPSLGLLLGAAKVIAKRGVSTKREKAKSPANGGTTSKGASKGATDPAALAVVQEATGGGASAGTGTVTTPAPAGAASGSATQTAPATTAGGGGAAAEGAQAAHS